MKPDRIKKSLLLVDEINCFLKLPRIPPQIKSPLEEILRNLEQWNGEEYYPYVSPIDYWTVGSDNIQ